LLDKVKKAKELKEQGIKIKDMEEDVGIARAYIPKLLELYEAMSEKNNVPVINNPDYVVVRRQKYINLSIKIQNKFEELRKEYTDYKRVMYREKSKLLNAKYSLATVKELKEELDTKQLFLNVTSKNLQHAEDGYEYIKKEYIYSKIQYFLIGVAFAIISLSALRQFGIIS